MIFLTRIDQTRFALNSDLIEHIDVTPDTIIVLTNGEKLRVRESAEKVVERIIEFRRSLLAGLPAIVSTAAATHQKFDS